MLNHGSLLLGTLMARVVMRKRKDPLFLEAATLIENAWTFYMFLQVTKPMFHDLKNSQGKFHALKLQ